LKIWTINLLLFPVVRLPLIRNVALIKTNLCTELVRIPVETSYKESVSVTSLSKITVEVVAAGTE